MGSLPRTSTRLLCNVRMLRYVFACMIYTLCLISTEEQDAMIGLMFVFRNPASFIGYYSIQLNVPEVV